eukprot:11084063-Heterocapsa_arctica.AAC.1
MLLVLLVLLALLALLVLSPASSSSAVTSAVREKQSRQPSSQFHSAPAGTTQRVSLTETFKDTVAPPSSV